MYTAMYHVSPPSCRPCVQRAGGKLWLHTPATRWPAPGIRRTPGTALSGPAPSHAHSFGVCDSHWETFSSAARPQPRRAKPPATQGPPDPITRRAAMLPRSSQPLISRIGAALIHSSALQAEATAAATASTSKPADAAVNALRSKLADGEHAHGRQRPAGGGGLLTCAWGSMRAGPDLGDFISGKDLSAGTYSVEAPSWKVTRLTPAGWACVRVGISGAAVGSAPAAAARTPPCNPA